MAPQRTILVACALVAGSLAWSNHSIARPPSAATATSASQRAPIAGRLRLRDGLIELSVDTLAEGGAAHDVAEGVAVQADAVVDKRQERAEPSVPVGDPKARLHEPTR